MVTGAFRRAGGGRAKRQRKRPPRLAPSRGRQGSRHQSEAADLGLRDATGRRDSHRLTPPAAGRRKEGVPSPRRVAAGPGPGRQVDMPGERRPAGSKDMSVATCAIPFVQSMLLIELHNFSCNHE